MYHHSFASGFGRLQFFYHLYQDFVKAVQAFEGVKKPVVTIFGSGMTPSEHPYYQQAYALGQALADAQFGVLTGGGRGLMEASNLGAMQRQGRSYACRILLSNNLETLQMEAQKLYLLEHRVHSFWLRKLFLIRPSMAFVVLPGGFGTLDEVFEVLTLIRTGKLDPRPVIFLGHEYWQPLRAFLEERLMREGMIDRPDLDEVVSWVDEVSEVLDVLQRVSG